MPILRNDKRLKKLTVAALYKEVTGKAWHTAKKEGLTDGSYKQNAELRLQLLGSTETPKKLKSKTVGSITKDGTKPKVTSKKSSKSDEESKDKEVGHDFSRASSFGEAFKTARELLGEDNIFYYKNKQYTTNYAPNAKAKNKVSANLTDNWEEEELDVENIEYVPRQHTDNFTEELVSTEVNRDMEQRLSRSDESYKDRTIREKNLDRNKLNYIMHSILSRNK